MRMMVRLKLGWAWGWMISWYCMRGAELEIARQGRLGIVIRGVNVAGWTWDAGTVLEGREVWKGSALAGGGERTLDKVFAVKAVKTVY